MSQKIKSKSQSKPLSLLVTVPPKTYSSANIQHDDIVKLRNYLPSASTLDIVDLFSTGLAGAKNGRMLSITGPYGSGKSTMAIFLKGLFAPSSSQEWNTAHTVLKNESVDIAKKITESRQKTNTHKHGLITCVATARREPISATILTALDDGATAYFGRYNKGSFSKASNLKKYVKNPGMTTVQEITEIISSLCKVAPVTIIIDEFGKNIEYFTTDEEQQSDLFLLQELAEMSGPGRKIPLAIITLQHMAFEEYAAGTSHARKQEWAKIQGRFDDIPFANSPNQTRQLISKTIQLDQSNSNRRIVKRWAKKRAVGLQQLGIDGGFDSDLIASCYPLDPLALEVIPELCSRYGQHERTLLSFITGGSKNTVATFIDENDWRKDHLPAMGLDVLYDYFIAGTSMIHSSSANITRLLEIETIIRDSHGLDELEIKTLKTIGILNLIGRSGYLRSSRQLIDYAIKENSKSILKRLEEKSIITYREHSDEYRIWHGTDIDIAAELDTHRKRYKNLSLTEMLKQVIDLEPVVATKHNIRYGTMRIFKRQFVTMHEIEPFSAQTHDKQEQERFVTLQEIELDDTYDGAIVYKTNNVKNISCNKPLIVVEPTNTSEIRHAAIEVIAIRDILQNNQRITSDWVARKELEERLADAEIHLDRIFDENYGRAAKWSYGKSIINDTPSAIASKVSDRAYGYTPQIYNEMINRTALSSQGSAAKRKLLEFLIANTEKHCFGIEGYGPERATYEAIFIKNELHVPTSKLDWKLQDPRKDNTLYPVWNAILSTIRTSKKRVSLVDIHQVCKMPPYGMKTGPIDIIMVAILLLYKNNIALYEHGTYFPKIGIEVIERMIKNPEHFELKYFKSTPAKKKLLQRLIKDLKINSEGSVLDVVSHLVRVVSALPPYVRQTKKIDRHSIAVRDTIATAIEPDTLLFESLPKVLGFRTFATNTDADIAKFSKILTKSTNTLQTQFQTTVLDIKELLFASTGIDDRKKLSETASVVLSSVSDQKMKVFLTAVNSDILEKDEDWINYVALSLTDTPMISWKDDDREMFENNLISVSTKFKRLASIHFAKVSKNFVKPSYQVTVTNADGTEHHNVVSLRPEQRKKINDIAIKVIKEMQKQGLVEKDIHALIAALSSKILKK